MMKIAHWLCCAALGCAAVSVSAQTPPAATPHPGATGAAGAMPASGERNEAGKIDLVAGPVTVVGTDQKQRTPKKGEKLFEGDSIVTNANGELHAELTDGGVLAVRPNTAMLISKYQANGAASDTSVFGLIKGSFRSITGWIGKANQANYKIITPTATVGVRGTDHEPTVIPEGAKEGEPGTYDRVHAGASFIESQNGRVDVAQGRAGFFAAHGRERPRVLDQVPAFYRPARNDARLAGRHERIAATHDQRREQRVKAVQAARVRAESRIAPRPDAAQARRAAQEQQRQKQTAGREKLNQQRQQRQQEAQNARAQQPQARQDQAKARAEQAKARQAQQQTQQEQRKAAQEQKKAQKKAQQNAQQTQAQKAQAGASSTQQRPRPQAKESHTSPQQR